MCPLDPSNMAASLHIVQSSRHRPLGPQKKWGDNMVVGRVTAPARHRHALTVSPRAVPVPAVPCHSRAPPPLVLFVPRRRQPPRLHFIITRSGVRVPITYRACLGFAHTGIPNKARKIWLSMTVSDERSCGLATGILVKYFWSGMPYKTILVRLKTIHGLKRRY